VLLLEGNVLSVQGVDTVNHALDELDLGVAQTMLVGDIVGDASLAARFTAGTTGLNLEFFTSLLKSIEAFLGPAGEIHVDGGPHAGTKVGGAGVDIAVLGVKHEFLAALGLDGVTDGLDTAGEALKDGPDVTTVLHGDDPKLILFINPDEEGLLSIVVDTTTLGPVALHTSHSEVGITRHEEEVIVDELLADLLVHASQGEVLSSEITGELTEGALHEVLNAYALVLGDAGGKTEAVNAAANADPDGVDRDFRVDVALDLLNFHVGGVDSIGGDTVVFLDDGIEDILEILVGIPVTSIDTAVLVIELDSAGDGLSEGEARSGGLVVSKLLPPFLGDVLGHQGVLALDVWVGLRHVECGLR